MSSNSTTPVAPKKASTPQLLSWMRLIAIVLLLIFGFASVMFIEQQTGLTNNADERADQADRFGLVSLALHKSHNAAANSLVTPNDPKPFINTAQRELTVATSLIFDAAASTQTKQQLSQLRELSALISDYEVLQLHATTLRGDASAVTALNQAAKKRSEAQLIIETLSSDEAAMTQSLLNDHTMLSLPISFAIITIIALVAALVITARASHRVLNLGIVGALIGTTMIMLGCVSLAQGSSQVSDTLTAVTTQTNARTNIAFIYGNQITAVLNQSWPSAAQENNQKLLKSVETELGQTNKDDHLGTLTRFTQTVEDVSAKLATKDWDGASALITKELAETTALFDTILTRYYNVGLPAIQADTDVRLSSLSAWRLLTVGCTLIGIVLVWWGLNMRIREY